MPLSKFTFLLWFIISIILVLQGCIQRKECVAVNNSKKMIFISNHSLLVEISESFESQKCGLSGRLDLPKDEGMLFLFKKEGLYPFWMKDTSIPISIAFISKNNIIINIEDMAPNALIKYYPQKPALYAIETNIGWFSKNKIKIGDRINLNN